MFDSKTAIIYFINRKRKLTDFEIVDLAILMTSEIHFYKYNIEMGHFFNDASYYCILYFDNYCDCQSSMLMSEQTHFLYKAKE